MVRPRRLSHGALVALVLVVGCHASSTGPLVGDAARLLPPDDGSAIVILYGSEMLGSIDGCGCMGDPRLGGMPYRASFAKGLRAARPDAAILLVDVGASMAAVTAGDGREAPDFVLQDEWTTTSLDRMAFDAVNVTAREIPFLSRYLHPERWATAAAERPVLARFVSANVLPTRSDAVTLPAYVVRSVGTARGGAATIRVAIAGVSQPDATLDPSSGYRIEDPATALARTLPAARSESDVVVVLAYVPPRQVPALVAAIGNLADVVIVASSLSGDVPPSLDTSPRIAYSWYKTQNLGVLGLRIDGHRVASATNAFVKMADPLPRDADMVRTVDDASRAVREAKEQRFAEAAAGSS